MDIAGLGSVITAVTAGLASLVVAFNGRGRRRDEFDEEDRQELDELRDWRSLVVRWYLTTATAAISYNFTLPDLPAYPPEKASRRSRRGADRDELP